MRRALMLATLVTSISLVSGCQAASTIDPMATATDSAPSSTLPASGPRPPALAQLVVSPEGLGSLLVGEAPPATDPATDILVFDPQACAWAAGSDPNFPAESVSRWVANYNADGRPGENDPFGVLIQHDVVSIITIVTEEIETTEGIHLGMTRDELLAAYPDELLFETEGQGVEGYRLRGAAGDLVFTVWEFDEPGSWRIGWINAGNPGFEVPLYGTDAWGWWMVCFAA